MSKSARPCEGQFCTFGGKPATMTARDKRLKGRVNFSKEDQRYLCAACRGPKRPHRAKRRENRLWPSQRKTGQAFAVKYQRDRRAKSYMVEPTVLDAIVIANWQLKKEEPSPEKIRKVVRTIRMILRLPDNEILTEQMLARVIASFDRAKQLKEDATTWMSATAFKGIR